MVFVLQISKRIMKQPASPPSINVSYMTELVSYPTDLQNLITKEQVYCGYENQQFVMIILVQEYSEQTMPLLDLLHIILKYNI